MNIMNFRPMQQQLVLVVDDNQTHLRVCELLLDRFGYGSCCVATCRDALDAFTTTDSFGAVLMDWKLPDLNGIHCMQKMRDIDSRRSKRTPIIAVTASAMAGDRESCLSSGMDDYLAKPFSTQDFQTVLSKHIPPLTLPSGSGVLAMASSALAQGDSIGADVAIIQIVSFYQHIFGSNKAEVLSAVRALVGYLVGRNMLDEAAALEYHAEKILK